MLQLHIAVCDDEPFAAQAVSSAAVSCLEKNGAHATSEIFSSATELAKRIEDVGFDLVLLDIEMPEVDGIQMARAMRMMGSRTDIVFVSNNESRVFEALPVRPLAFVRKSHFSEDMATAMEAFVKQRRKSSDERMITLKMHGSMGTFSVDKIAYVEGRRRDKVLHMTNGHTEEVVATLEELEEKLVPLGFCRVHKGYLVNLARVENISPDSMTVCGDTVPISRSRSEQVRLDYLDYLSKNNAIMM
ncbi:MAG: LytR/AlgR family response regulator transcription factor [Tractidigestivibacter sp.]|jgi:two-component system response regulator LytT|uniref:LytR/AlgR family response regulator transcription factor n=1 Tax=Tractidigestivibacter sp. TaxID=2847320 RepID=UPI003D89E747